MKKGLFITLEGPDGSGKTTVATLIVEELKKRGFSKNTAMDARTEALLYAASRRQHLVERVFPALKEGKIVLCERFLDSSLAYQGYGRQIGFDDVLKINDFAIEGCFPDLTLFLDIDEEEGLKRIGDRAFKDRLDQESIDFHHRVKQGYEEVLRRFPERIRIVDASRPVEEVLKNCLDIILEAAE